MFIENFNKIIISELKFVLNEMPEEDRTPEALISKFSEYIGESFDKKKKKASVKKEALSADIRCCALKKDGVQCNGRKSNKEDPEIKLCSLHIRSGAKFGYYVEGESSDAEVAEVIEVQPKKKSVIQPKNKAVAPKKNAAKSDGLNDLDDLDRIISNLTEEVDKNEDLIGTESIDEDDDFE